MFNFINAPFKFAQNYLLLISIIINNYLCPLLSHDLGHRSTRF